MIFLLFTAVLFLWLIQRQWKIRRILKLSRALRNKYTAWPIVGHGLMFLRTAEGRMQTFQKLAREAYKSKYGSISLWLGSCFCIITCDATVAETVSKTCLEKPKELAQAAKHLAGNVPIFAPETIFGIKIETQKQPLHPFLLALDKYLKIIPACYIQPNLPWEWLFEHIPVPIFKEVKQNKRIIHEFVNKIIKNKTISLQDGHYDIDRRINVDSHTDVQSTPFLDHLIMLSTADDGVNGYTEVELREETLLLLGAGNDTSAVGSSFTIVMLSRHPDIQEKAYKEVRSIFGDSKRLATYEDLQKLKYIEAVIKETLRLYPPVPAILRDNEVDIEIASGMVAPAGIYTLINIWGLHRNPKYWGADVEQFNPDRFLNGPPVDGAAYMPFSYGPRNCIGYKYAMMSMKVVVSTMLRQYKLLPPSEMSPEDLKKPLRLEYCIMMKDVDNFKVRLEHRM